MKQLLEYPYNSTDIFRFKRKLKKELISSLKNPKKLKIAILGGSTTHNLVEIIELFLLKYNFSIKFYESEYGQFWNDVMFDNSALEQFKPDIIYVFTTNRNITEYPDVNCSKEEVIKRLEKQYNHFEIMWNTIQNKYNCIVIQNNFDLLYYRLLGNLDSIDFRGKNHFILDLNKKFEKYANSNQNFKICDINYISAQIGLDKWTALDDWYRYKYAMCIDCLPEVAANFSAMVKAIYGKNNKFIACDLDNTLWGGVVGDDGVNGLEIGTETYEGQAYREFQQYLAELKKLGIILTVNSKNDESNAIAGLSHPSNILHQNDFIVIKANWENKNDNLISIANELNLGVDSCLFLDDNPVEREIIKNSIPSVNVPLFDSVIHYIKYIDRNAYFETVTISTDDLQREKMYRGNVERQKLQQSFNDYNDFLQSLEMRAEIDSFKEIYFSRIVQLINKSNQFNLTTRRYNLPEIQALVADPNTLCLYGRLEDKFGDNGIVSLVIGKIFDSTMEIILWLMSCRVLKRGMEDAMMDAVVTEAKKHDVSEINGKYIPSPKNAMVKDFYQNMGFQFLSEEADGSTNWNLNLNNYLNRNKNIKIIANEAKS